MCRLCQPSFLYTMPVICMTSLRCVDHSLYYAISLCNVPLAGSKVACTTLANILLQAHVLDVSDKEKSLRCLRRQDKLSN